MLQETRPPYLNLYFRFQHEFKPVKSYQQQKDIIIKAIADLSNILVSANKDTYLHNFVDGIKLVYPNYFKNKGEKGDDLYYPITDDLILMFGDDDPNESELGKRVLQHLSYYLISEEKDTIADVQNNEFIRISESLIRNERSTVSSFYVENDNGTFKAKVHINGEWDQYHPTINPKPRKYPTKLKEGNKVYGSFKSNDAGKFIYNYDLGSEKEIISLKKKTMLGLFKDAQSFCNSFADPLAAHLVMLEASSLLYVYSQTAQIGKDDNLGYGGLFVLLSPNLSDNQIEDYRIFFQLISDYISICVAHNIMQENMEKEAVKSAKAAIMSRNMSHNLGSHVMFYIKQKLESVNSILSEGTLLDLVKATSVDELKNIVDTKTLGDGKEIYFLVGLGRFINYLQERQDYIATIATDHIPYKSTVNFKDAIYDELKPELKCQRHKDDRSIDGKHTANLLLDYIAYSEGYHPSNKIELWFEDFNGTGKPHDVPPELRNFNVDLPGGTLGRQAFFSIMENIIRNTAKHEGSGMSGRNMKFVFKQLTKIDQLKAWTNDKNYPKQDSETIKIYDAEKNRSNYYYLGITVDLGVEANPDAITKIRNGLNEKYLNENGSMNDNGKGIKEIRISAAWMRGFWIDNAIPVDEPPAVAIRETEDRRLQYVICLPKPKRVAFVTGKDTELDDNGCRHIASTWIKQNDDERIKKIADFDLIVCPESLSGTIQKYVGSRILHVSDGMDYSNKNVSNLYQDWLEQQFKKEYSTGQLPILVINDGKAFENKQENEKWRDDAQAMIDGKKVECNSSDTISDQIVFAKHYNWSERGKKLRKDFYNKAQFLEGISGGNSTDRLVRHDTWDEEWYVKHMAAALTHVAIIDERIYNTFSVVKEGKITLPEWTENEEEIKKWLQKYKSELKNYKRPKYFLYDKARKDISPQITLECVETLLIQNNNEWTMTEDSLILKDYISKIHNINGSKDYSNAILFAQKGVCAFNIKPDVDKVTIKGYSPERKEEREVATITYDPKEKKLTTHCEEEFSKKFHFVSIHQGVLEKMYESLIKDDNGVKKSDVTRAVFDIFSNKEIVDDDFLPQFVIHSGRSKPNGDDMPQKQPFIQFAALDNAIHDCKYILTELLYSAHYES